MHFKEVENFEMGKWFLYDFNLLPLNDDSHKMILIPWSRNFIQELFLNFGKLKICFINLIAIYCD